MHRSRLGQVIIDCQTRNLDAAAHFWGNALGSLVEQFSEPANAMYRKLVTPVDQPIVLVQSVAHASRVHLDIETSDVEAEVVRLERLGARRCARVRDWWIMEAPTGHKFCVLPPQRADFEPVVDQKRG
jgi:hypothetical protein